MIGSGRLRRRRKLSDSEVNPMENIANLSDVMLVFACGLMVAIILFWRVDLNHVTDVVDRDEMREIGDLEQAIQDGTLSEGLESKGIAFEDPETGKMYIILPND